MAPVDAAEYRSGIKWQWLSRQEPSGFARWLDTRLLYIEVRDAAAYFYHIQDVKITKDMLDLAKHIVETKAGHFEPAKFQDHYASALQELLEKKQKRQPIVRPKRRRPAMFTINAPWPVPTDRCLVRRERVRRQAVATWAVSAA
jgi:hypothetical protein